MPGGDGTGPMGRGVMTGRGLGICTGAVPAGNGLGLGHGRGFGRCFVPYPTPVATVAGDRNFLEMQKQVLQARLSFLNKELEDLSEEDK